MSNSATQPARQWTEIELCFASSSSYSNPYTDVDMWVDFRGPHGASVRRPGFWDGGDTWKVRFASPLPEGEWQWKSHCTNRHDSGLHAATGRLEAQPYAGTNKLLKHGLLRMSSGKRTMVHADGYPRILVADTAWALPFRGTEETVAVYASDRQRKGFNAALLMTVQPDKYATGPRSRTEEEGFDVGFEDLPTGHICVINNEYFRCFDRLVAILVDHEIIPVYQPVFHGFGWKGKQVAGNDIPADEYARYCRYLVARYGAKPAIYLVGADAFGNAKGVAPGGKEIQEWDAYEQPTGIHYNPWADNRASQDADWLDFQWCQTGHANEHRQEKVAEMRLNRPVKAVANGEPTYEGMFYPHFGAGWWQGHEAWSNITAGGTMGIVYGAAGLWQWKLTAQEKGWDAWCDSPKSWRDALACEGSLYAGHVARVFEGQPFADMEPRIDLAMGKRCVAVENRFYVVYLEYGGACALAKPSAPLHYRWFDPVKGEWLGGGMVEAGSGRMDLNAPQGKPLVFVASTEKQVT